jgi:hypothetical protein
VRSNPGTDEKKKKEKDVSKKRVENKLSVLRTVRQSSGTSAAL